MELWQTYNISRPILITGETGTGKSHCARFIFDHSAIHKDKFLVMHMASIKEELMESELFGHKKGSFTGAIESRSGYLKEVGSGTLFIDEIGELSLEAQKKLLFLLEENRFVAVGESYPQKFQGRIIMATNKNLRDMVREKTFREDLYFRLIAFQLHLEPLRFDKKKLNELILKEWDFAKKKGQRNDLILSESVKTFFLNYSWPGNYRELKNAMEYLVSLSIKMIVDLDQVPAWMREEETVEIEKTMLKSSDYNSFYLEDYNASLEKFEAYYLRKAIHQYHGKVNETARRIGISKSALIYKARKYGINALKIKAMLSEDPDTAVA